MKIALILTICSALSGVNHEDDCDAYIVETYDSVIPCTIDMDKNRQVLDDRYLSCGTVDEKLLKDQRDGRSVSKIIHDINWDAK